jgi:hypothetical protein
LPLQTPAAHEKALTLAQTVEPEFQVRLLPSIRQKLEAAASARN